MYEIKVSAHHKIYIRRVKLLQICTFYLYFDFPPLIEMHFASNIKTFRIKPFPPEAPPISISSVSIRAGILRDLSGTKVGIKWTEHDKNWIESGLKLGKDTAMTSARACGRGH